MTRLQDDFYDYVNGKWAETAVIPDDKPSTGAVSYTHLRAHETDL